MCLRLAPQCTCELRTGPEPTLVRPQPRSKALPPSYLPAHSQLTSSYLRATSQLTPSSLRATSEQVHGGLTTGGVLGDTWLLRRAEQSSRAEGGAGGKDEAEGEWVELQTSGAVARRAHHSGGVVRETTLLVFSGQAQPRTRTRPAPCTRTAPHHAPAPCHVFNARCMRHA